jgi:sporulation protein YabP
VVDEKGTDRNYDRSYDKGYDKNYDKNYDKTHEKREHSLSLRRREELSLDGVQNVESFDDAEIVVETVAGGLVIKGEDLHITQLNLDGGNMAVRGFVESLQYTGDSFGKKSRGVLGRIFK